MRLAREVPKLDAENAQRVADLPLREAIKALAGPKATASPDPPPDNPFDINDPDWDAFAQALLNAPFDETDVGSPDGQEQPALPWRKLAHHLGIPPMVSLCIGMRDDYDLPALRLADPDDLRDALIKVAPVAKGEPAGLALAPGVHIFWAWITLMITAQYIVVAIWNEITDHEKLGAERYHLAAQQTADDLGVAIEARRATLAADRHGQSSAA